MAAEIAMTAAERVTTILGGAHRARATYPGDAAAAGGRANRSADPDRARPVLAERGVVLEGALGDDAPRTVNVPWPAVTRMTNFLIRLVPGATSPYSQLGVSGEMPRSQTSSTSVPPVIWGSASISTVSGPLLRMTSVKVTRVPCTAACLE